MPNEVKDNEQDQTGTPEQADQPVADSQAVQPAVEEPAETPAEQTMRVLRGLKVYGQETDFDLSDEQRLRSVLQKGLAYDRREEKLKEEVETRAQQILREQEDKRKEEARLADLREADPLAADFEVYRQQSGKTVEELKAELESVKSNLTAMQWNAQVQAVRPQYPNFTERDWNRAFADVVASNGQTSLADAARAVKQENAALEQQITNRILEQMKKQGKQNPPAPDGAGTAPVLEGEAPPVSFKDKDSVRSRVHAYLASLRQEE